MTSNWRPMKSPCKNCVIKLEGRPAWNTSIVIAGWEPMEYRHTDPGGCTTPGVYSGCNKYEEWKEGSDEDEWIETLQ